MFHYYFCQDCDPRGTRLRSFLSEVSCLSGELESRQHLADYRWKQYLRGFRKFCVYCLCRSRWKINTFTWISGDSYSSQNQLLNSPFQNIGPSTALKIYWILVWCLDPCLVTAFLITCCHSLVVLFQLLGCWHASSCAPTSQQIWWMPFFAINQDHSKICAWQHACWPQSICVHSGTENNGVFPILCCCTRIRGRSGH